MSGEADLDPLEHALPPEDHDAILRDQIVPTVLDPTPPADQPWALVLAGRAGSGKTSLKAALLAAAEAADPDGFQVPVELGTDDLREFHPAWRQLLRDDDVTAAFHTAHDCRGWVDEAVAYCTRRHPTDPAKGGPKPLVLDSQLNDPGRVRQLLGRLRDAGYAVRVVFVAAPVAISQLSVLQRYHDMRLELGGGRFAEDPGASDAGILASVRAIEDDHLADTVEIYRRAATVPVYAARVAGAGRGQAPARSAEVLAREWDRPWTADEIAWFARRATVLADQLDPALAPHLISAVQAALPHVGEPHRSTLAELERRLTGRHPAPGPARSITAAQHRAPADPSGPVSQGEVVGPVVGPLPHRRRSSCGLSTPRWSMRRTAGPGTAGAGAGFVRLRVQPRFPGPRWGAEAGR